MSKQKRMTDDELEAMGRKISDMHEMSITLWEDAMRTVLLASPLYKKICTSGLKVQDTYLALKEEAYRRGWSTEKIGDVFKTDIACHFN